jgi:hypothetical protein
MVASPFVEQKVHQTGCSAKRLRCQRNFPQRERMMSFLAETVNLIVVSFSAVGKPEQNGANSPWRAAALRTYACQVFNLFSNLTG